MTASQDVRKPELDASKSGTREHIVPQGSVVAGRYKLLRVLGEGGMGTVWLAHDTSLDSNCAIKLIYGENAQSAELRRRFEREAKASAQLRGNNVVDVFDYGVWNDIPFIAMEFLEGEDLAQRLERVGRLSPAETYRIIVHVCRALSRAHARGIVHRDLKPENIFLTDMDGEEVAKVLDFGIAKNEKYSVRDNTTQLGAFLGTPHYVSPEQARGEPTDGRSDLWALAVISFQAVTGRLPFYSESLGSLMGQILYDPIPRPSKIADDVPKGFDAWWVRASKRQPEERFQTAQEFGDELAVALGVGHRLTIPSLPPRASSLPPAVDDEADRSSKIVITGNDGQSSNLQGPHIKVPPQSPVPGPLAARSGAATSSLPAPGGKPRIPRVNAPSLSAPNGPSADQAILPDQSGQSLSARVSGDSQGDLPPIPLVPSAPPSPLPPPGQAPPGQAPPGQALPGQALPGQALPGQALPGQGTPGQVPGLAGQALPADQSGSNPAIKQTMLGIGLGADGVQGKADSTGASPQMLRTRLGMGLGGDGGVADGSGPNPAVKDSMLGAGVPSALAQSAALASSLAQPSVPKDLLRPPPPQPPPPPPILKAPDRSQPSAPKQAAGASPGVASPSTPAGGAPFGVAATAGAIPASAEAAPLSSRTRAALELGQFTRKSIVHKVQEMPRGQRIAAAAVAGLAILILLMVVVSAGSEDPAVADDQSDQPAGEQQASAQKQAEEKNAQAQKADEAEKTETPQAEATGSLDVDEVTDEGSPADSDEAEESDDTDSEEAADLSDMVSDATGTDKGGSKQGSAAKSAPAPVKSRPKASPKRRQRTRKPASSKPKQSQSPPDYGI